MISGEQEGVIKYQLDHHNGPLPAELNVAELNAWRSVLHRLNLIGQTAERYHGLGFGNISCRLADSEQFLISGSQTGHLFHLNRQHFALIQAASPQQNYIRSLGLCSPSSEALTHAAVYQQTPDIQAVIHVHSPKLWRHTQTLQLPHTAADIPYGTPEMAAAVAKLFESSHLPVLALFSMLGHEDGIIACGASLASAVTLLIEQWVKAEILEQALHAS